MFKIKKFSALSISVLLSITTLFSCSTFSNSEKLSFVKEEKTQDLYRMKDLIIDNVKDSSSINDVFSKFEE